MRFDEAEARELDAADPLGQFRNSFLIPPTMPVYLCGHSLGLQPKSYTLATIHRAENTDDPRRLRGIFEGFALFGGDIVLPLHPRTRNRLAAVGPRP